VTGLSGALRPEIVSSFFFPEPGNFDGDSASYITDPKVRYATIPFVRSSPPSNTTAII
jgi:hypothetical protein